MRSDRFERETAERLRRARPPDGLEERLVRSARAQAAGRGRRGRARAVVLAVAALSVVGAGVAAGVVVQLGGDGDTVPAGPAARAAIAESGVLARAPWLAQRSGSARVQEAPSLPALGFPPGTTYADALRALLGSVVSAGALPAGAALAPALPRHVVWAGGAGADRPRLSLLAPWGYTLPAGRIRAPVLRLGAGTSGAQAREILGALRQGRATGRPLPAQVVVEAPALARCQVMRPGAPRDACALAPTGRDG